MSNFSSGLTSLAPRRLVHGLLGLVVMWSLGALEPARLLAADYRIGVAQVDITPDYPIRLSGFGFRRTESEGVTQRIWAKAMAIDDPGLGPVVLVTVDNLAIPDYLAQEVAGRLEKQAKVARNRFTITCTHTHTAPMLRDVCPTLFGVPIPAEHLEHIARYTRELTDHIEKVCLEAVRGLRPARLEFGIGQVSFAINRRTKGGPVDHDLPVIAVRGPEGKILAILTSYACHCVTLSHNKISGDWAGYAQEAIQREHPGAIALLSVGCGADSNPNSGVTGDRIQAATEQGAQIAAEVSRLLRTGLKPLQEPVRTQLERIQLDFDKHPTRPEWQSKAKQNDAVGHHARVQLAKLDRDEALATQLSYPVQTWTFGDQLAMVFLPGEVVVDYSLRLKRELDRARVWVHGYANDEPCYIPSERVLREGGYEGGDAMVYYDRPTRFAAGLEQKIIEAVRRQLPRAYDAPKGTEGTAPRAALDALRSIRTKPGLTVDLAAAEPLVLDPVAIDWGADGRLWVCEMADYPMGLDNQWKPGGRVRFLQDTNADGRYDTTQVFLDQLPFPTGVTAWGKGVLVCAAPDILYAEDTNGDGQADVVKKLFSGFHTENYQARVNSLCLGLDNWIHGANGLLGGLIRGSLGGREINIRNQDFRFKPATGEFEPTSGLTQQGRVRDDWDNWFGCDNGTALRFYPLADRYLRRNPHVPAPEPSLFVPAYANAHRIFPVSTTLPRFNDLDHVGRITSGCGLGLYRDELLGAEYQGNGFTCEPVHNLVHREVLQPAGVRFTSRRAQDEQASEFLASTDHWFRPVQVRTGPDGALWIVDMYRFLIEHPRWIQAERLAQIDVRAGSDRGRLYRVYPHDASLRPIRDLTRLSTEALVQALESPNGTERDRAHAALLTRNDPTAAQPLLQLARLSARPAVRAQAWCVLDGLGALTPAAVLQALNDPAPQVRRLAVRLTEPLLATPAAAEFAQALLRLAEDPEPTVRFQLASSLGEWNDPRAGRALAALVSGGVADPYMRAALLSSATNHCAALLAAALALPFDAPGRDELLPKLVATAGASHDDALFRDTLRALLAGDGNQLDPVRWTALANLCQTLDRRPTLRSADNQAGDLRLLDAARARAAALALEPSAAEAVRAAALSVVKPSETQTLRALLAPNQPPSLQQAAAGQLGRNNDPAAARILLEGWNHFSPILREQVLGILVSRDNSAALLLAAIRAGDIPSSALSAVARDRLLNHPNAQLREQARAAFPAASDSARADVLAQFQAAASLPGVPSSGEALFVRLCATCHSHAGFGHDVGPSLAALQDKDPAYWLKNILDPNAVVEPRYVNYFVDTQDGRSLSGLLQSESATTVTLVQPNGLKETILRNSIAEVRASGLSLMPEGLEQGLKPQDLADLIAFVRRSGPPKRFPGNHPALVKAEPDGCLRLSATNGEIHGGSIAFEPEFTNIGMWHGSNDHVAWTVTVDAARDYEVHLDYACHPQSAGNLFVIQSGDGPADLRGTVASTGGWDTYRQIKLGTLPLRPGQQRIVFRPAAHLKAALLDLRTLVLAPKGIAPKWPRPAPADGLPRDPVALARVILDPTRTQNAREAAVNANPQFGPELIREMTRDLEPGTPAEYQRIPWVWRVAILAGKRNDAAQIRKILAVSLPEPTGPLRDWQAVVLGGGLINGLSQQGVWPGERLAEILGSDPGLNARWRHALNLASAMADDTKVPTGTRYDALRMLGVEPWEKRGQQLAGYLARGTHEELQMGAVSGLADVPSPSASRALVEGLTHCTPANRKLALDALLRDAVRAECLLEAIDQSRVRSADLGDTHRRRLTEFPEEKIRLHAQRVLAP